MAIKSNDTITIPTRLLWVIIGVLASALVSVSGLYLVYRISNNDKLIQKQFENMNKMQASIDKTILEIQKNSINIEAYIVEMRKK